MARRLEHADEWVAEIEQRIEAYDRGETRASSWDEVLGRLRRKLAEHRDRQAAT